MKTILLFNDTQEDKSTLAMYQKSLDMVLFVNDWETFMRSVVKHRELTDEQSAIVHELRDQYYRFKNEYNLE